MTGGVASLLGLGLASCMAGQLGARLYSVSRVRAYWWCSLALMTWGCALCYAAGLIRGRWG